MQYGLSGPSWTSKLLIARHGDARHARARRLDCLWVGVGLADVRPFPLTNDFGFTIATASDDRHTAPAEAPKHAMTAGQVADGRRWSAKVVLFSGVSASALHATAESEFQVQTPLFCCACVPPISLACSA